MAKVSKEEIDKFLNGTDPMERIIKFEGSYNESVIHIYYRDENGNMCVQNDNFYPFLWAKLSACNSLYNGDKEKLKKKIMEYGIVISKLQTCGDDGIEHPRMSDGYKFLFQAKNPMSFTKFLEFFEDAGVPVYGKGDTESAKSYLVVSNIEQYMIYSGRRLFKGYNDYNDLTRLCFDLETTGLDPENGDTITQIGIRTNKGFEKIITVTGQGKEKEINEVRAIYDFFGIIKELRPDVITGYNSENFDWNFIDKRLQSYHSSLQDASKDFFGTNGIYKKSKLTPLKLGGETEYYYPTVMYAHNLTDGLFSVRRAQALDSNMKKTNLKYITKYSKLNKANRVYIPGNMIQSTWDVKERDYALSEKNGEWFRLSTLDLDETFIYEGKEYKKYLFKDRDTLTKTVLNEIKEEDGFTTEKHIVYTKNDRTEYEAKLLKAKEEGDEEKVKEFEAELKEMDEYNVDEEGNYYENKEVKNYKVTSTIESGDYRIVTGQYIAERYLLDDIHETDLVELRYNQSNFLVCKMLPTSFEKCCTMGTAGIWKLIMMAWSYQHNLAIPKGEDKRNFTGGLSRLLKVGFVQNIVKLDYNSLYPSIILTYGIKTPIDIMGAMPSMLEYVLTQREKYKELKSVEGKKAKKIKETIEEGSITDENEIEKLKNEAQQHSSLSALYDKMQLPLKILGNSFFGSFGSDGKIFPWCDMDAAEKTTCIGRQSLRLMIGVFSTPKDELLPCYKKGLENGTISQEELDKMPDIDKLGLGYEPVVGDSFTKDTPLFIKYDDNDYIDIKPISEIFDDKNFRVDAYGREYDYTSKPYQVLCRSGWETPAYVYRHKTDKDIYRVETEHGYIDVTEDHSLFDIDKDAIKPSQIDYDTELEFSPRMDSSNKNASLGSSFSTVMESLERGEIDRLPVWLLNCSEDVAASFLMLANPLRFESSKLLKAGYNYIKSKLMD